MKQEIRVNFLNWRPDSEASGHDGLTVADNCIHDTEGYKGIYAQTAAAFGTTNPLTGTAIPWVDIQVRPFGIGGDLVYCGLRASTSSAAVYVGVVGEATAIAGQSPTIPFGGTLISANACRIEAFFVTEFDQRFLVTARVTGDRVTGTTEALHVTRLVDYTFE